MKTKKINSISKYEPKSSGVHSWRHTEHIQAIENFFLKEIGMNVASIHIQIENEYVSFH